MIKQFVKKRKEPDMIVIEPFKGKSVLDQKVEIVERKGTASDFICDSVMDAISVALSQAYLKEFGAILHHNIDKGLFAAVLPGVRRRKVVRPMELTIGDRATFAASGRKSCRRHCHRRRQGMDQRESALVDPEQQLVYRVILAPGSEELTDIFSRPGQIAGANDTSAAVGYFPLSPTETAVLQLERYLNSRDFKKMFPETGEDIKVMGLRKGKNLDVTVAMPLISHYVSSESDYFAKKDMIQAEMQEFLVQFSSFNATSVHYNTLDRKGRGARGIYMTLTDLGGGCRFGAGGSGQPGERPHFHERPMGTGGGRQESGQSRGQDI
jgi:S-adenosylmethionine synthetase